MSYALRNSLVLLATLLLLGGSAFAYIKFVQQSEINNLSTELVSLNTDYDEKVKIRDQYQPLMLRYDKAREIVQNYDKKLYLSSNPDDVYDYLSEINDANLELFYDFVFQDSVIQDQYGILRSRIVGTGIYSDFVTFINKIENSSLLNKVDGVSVSLASGFDTPDYVDFSLQLNSYYQKLEFESSETSQESFRIDSSVSVYNPMKPLILGNIPDNIDNLINIQSSRLLGLTSTRVFIVDQAGINHVLKPGDKIYLGYLQEINIKDREVVFSLDKGGIKELFTLKVER